ncbi:MAG: SCO family protein [Pirellulaceae bacterium]
MMQRLNAVKCLLPCLFFVMATKGFSQPQQEMLGKAGIEPKIGGSLPAEAIFVDHHGNAVSIDEIVCGQRPSVVCLVYFNCPMLCKLAADGLVRAAASIDGDVGDAFDVLLISFDPRDQPKQAMAARSIAVQRYGRDPTGTGWYFLTGNQNAIDQLTRSVGFRYAWDDETQQYAHAAGLIIVSPDGGITEYLDGVRFAPMELEAALRRADQKALTDSEGLTFARCYLYDPTTGKFGSVVHWAIRILGLLTVATLVVGIVCLSRVGSRVVNEGLDAKQFPDHD